MTLNPTVSLPVTACNANYREEAALMDREELTGLPVSGGFITSEGRGLAGQVRGANRTTCAASQGPFTRSTICVWKRRKPARSAFSVAACWRLICGGTRERVRPECLSVVFSLKESETAIINIKSENTLKLVHFTPSGARRGKQNVFTTRLYNSHCSSTTMEKTHSGLFTIVYVRA